MPLTSTIRGAPATTVPANERAAHLGGDGDADQAVVDRRGLLAGLSETVMPRSLATAGAETMFTSASIGRSTPASAAAVSGLTFSSATSPS